MTQDPLLRNSLQVIAEPTSSNTAHVKYITPRKHAALEADERDLPHLALLTDVRCQERYIASECDDASCRSLLIRKL